LSDLIPQTLLVRKAKNDTLLNTGTHKACFAKLLLIILVSLLHYKYIPKIDTFWVVGTAPALIGLE
jgi:hypothetical protein